jgi:multimeric flavodoxin WrbA
MRILVLVSSYRKNGNSARLARMIEAQIETVAERYAEPLTLEHVNLAHLDLRPCRGCRVCFDRGEAQCPLKDDLRTIRAKMDAADGVLVASPVYVNDVNGVAKNWIDRLAYLCHRPGLAGRCAYLIATVADSPTRHTLRTMNMAVRTWGAHIVGQAGFKMGALMPQAEVESQYQPEAAKVAEALFQAVAEQHFLRPSFLSLMIFKIQQISWQQAVDQDSLDYAYWKEHGWFDPDRTFYIEHRANPLKVALARTAGTVLAPFVT